MKSMVVAAALFVAVQVSISTAAPPAPPPPAMHGGVRARNSYSYPYGAYPYRGSYNYALGTWHRQPGTLRDYERFANPASKYPLGGGSQAGQGTGYWYW